MQRNVKLFHRVLYPKHLRLFNTTFDAEDPEKLYELCSVIVHIGGGPYHGHYVSVIKTEYAGWLLFDDEMVEAVDPNYVFNFFGDNKGMATAYVLFYQEVSPSQVEKECLYTTDSVQMDAAAVFDESASSHSAPGGSGRFHGSPAPIEEVDEALSGVGTASAEVPSMSGSGMTTSNTTQQQSEVELARQPTNNTLSSITGQVSQGQQPVVASPAVAPVLESQAPQPPVAAATTTSSPIAQTQSSSATSSATGNGSANSPSSFKLRSSPFGKKKKSKDESESKPKRGLSFSFRKSVSS
jgi:ubiquitin carboxyl-terminal hydrolase 9/13